MKREFERQTGTIKGELMEQVKSCQGRVSLLEEERRASDKRFAAFKQEYAKVLEDKSQLLDQVSLLRREVEDQTRELLDLKKEQVDFQQRLKLLLGSRNPSCSQTELLAEVETMADELRIRRDEALSYRNKITLTEQ